MLSGLATGSSIIWRCKPVIAAVEADAEPTWIAQEHDCCLVVEPDDVKALTDAILRIRREPLERMDPRGTRAFQERFDRLPTALGAGRGARLLETDDVRLRPARHSPGVE
jgi:hypothetical protein